MTTEITIADYLRHSFQSLGGRFQRRINLKRDNFQRTVALLQSLEEKVLQPEVLETLEFIFHPIETVRSGNIYRSRYGSQYSYYLLLGKDRAQSELTSVSTYRLFCIESPRGEIGGYHWVSHEKLLRALPEQEYKEVGYIV